MRLSQNLLFGATMAQGGIFRTMSGILHSAAKVQSIKVFTTVFYGPFLLENILDLLFW